MMKATELAELYRNRQQTFERELRDVSARINVISNLRLVVAAVFLGVVYFAFKIFLFFYFLPLIVVAFVLLMRKHARLFEAKTHLINLVALNEVESKAVTGNPDGFDAGTAFAEIHHAFAYDLDLFGDKSLYQFLCRANTFDGKSRLASRLKHPLTTTTEIEDTQRAIRDLADRLEFRQHFFAAGKEIDEKGNDRAQLTSWLNTPSFIFGKPFFRIALVVLPVITVVLLIVLMFTSAAKPFLILMAIVQWTILGLNVKKVNAFHDYIGRKKNVLQKYAALLHHLEQEKFQSPLMENIGTSAKDAGKKMRSLANLVYNLDSRANAMVSLVVNSLFMYDLQYVYRLEKWKAENTGRLLLWLDAVAQTEVLNSFATFAYNNQHFTFPSVTTTLQLDAKDVGHPLIPAEESVPNSFTMARGENILIITGANMAGKSTFLRTIGVNLVLALNGSPVFAREFTCPLISLRTGMRTADSLKDHQSYFYAELDRLKGIMDELRQQRPLLILLDEILKGTNSTDKQAGSIALVKQLLPYPCLAIVATHDLALGELEKQFPQQVRNFHFEANIEDDQLSFDYKLKPGLAEKMNATFLMKKMGIIPR